MKNRIEQIRKQRNIRQEDFAKALTSALNSIVKDNQQLFPAHLYRKNKAIDSADMEPMRVWLKNNF